MRVAVGDLVSWVKTCALYLGLLTVGSYTVSAEEKPWQPPALVPNNPVLERAKKWQSTIHENKAPIASLAGYPEFFLATTMFWDKLRAYDRDMVIGEASPIDGVGMTYPVPFTVWFPTSKGAAQLREAARVPILEQWDDPGRQVWLFNSSDVFPDDAHPFFAPRNRVFVVFKIDLATGGATGDCHARQVITILYTGKTDGAALVSCLENEGAE